jgi:hypothetical protein
MVTPVRPAASRPSKRKPPKLPAGARVRVLRTELTAPSTGVELFPVDRPEPHVIAAARIYSTMLFGDEPELRSHPSTIELATYRSSLNGGRIEFGDAASPHSVRSLLAWVVVYNDIRPVWPDTGGPYIPPGSPSPTPKPVPTDCQWVYLANAVTGRYVSAFGSCPGELAARRK